MVNDSSYTEDNVDGGVKKSSPSEVSSVCSPCPIISGLCSCGGFSLLPNNRKTAIHETPRNRRVPAAIKIGTPTFFKLFSGAVVCPKAIKIMG